MTDTPKNPDSNPAPSRSATERLLEQLDRHKSIAAVPEGIARVLADIERMKTVSIPELSIADTIRLPRIPKQEEVNEYQGASVLLRRLASSIAVWRKELPSDFQPAVVALLNGGVQINVDTLSQESFHGIRISGRLNGVSCVVFSHQSTIQLLCYPEPINPPENPRRPIGFIIDGKSTEA